MDNILKTKNKKYEFNFCSISNMNLFYKKLLFEIINKFPKNTTKKHCNIIFLDSHKKTHTILFKFERNIMNEWKTYF
jgi:hypothetical protein